MSESFNNKKKICYCSTMPRNILRELNFKWIMIACDRMIWFSKIWVHYNKLKSEVVSLRAENTHLKSLIEDNNKRNNIK